MNAKRIMFLIALPAACIAMAMRQDAASDGDSIVANGIEFDRQEIRQILTLSPLPDVPADSTNRYSDLQEAAQFGQVLFFEEGLSVDGATSCATCHKPELAFTDGKPLSEGAQAGVRNTPTLLNVVYQRWFFWDGRADSLWAQAFSPLENPIEMAGDRLSIVLHIRSDPKLRRAYEEVFGAIPTLPPDDDLPRRAKPMIDESEHAMHIAWMSLTGDQRDAVDAVFVNLGKALAAYQRRLVTGPSPFDQFVGAVRRGDADGMNALDPAALRGLKLFVGKAGCRDCHNGPLLSDMEFHTVGVPGTPGLGADSGRYGGIEDLLRSDWRADSRFSDDPKSSAATRTASLLRSPGTWGQFRTPSLRNVALTPPYMHQGQYADLRVVLEHYSTLEDAVNLGHHQEQVLTPLNLTEQEMDELTSFLKSLTGTLPDESLLMSPD